MNVTIKQSNVDLFMLFVHDRGNGCWPSSRECLEEAINERLGELGSDYQVACPYVGRSWKVGGMTFGRLHSVKEVKVALPDILVSHLEQIDQEGITL